MNIDGIDQTKAVDDSIEMPDPIASMGFSDLDLITPKAIELVQVNCIDLRQS